MDELQLVADAKYVRQLEPLAARAPGVDGEVAGPAREVPQLAVEGRSAKEIVDALRISRCTAESRKARPMETMGVQNTTEVIRYAARTGASPVWPALRFAQRASRSFASFIPAPGLLQLPVGTKRSRNRGQPSGP